MTTDPQTLLKRLMPTAHRLLLEKILRRELPVLDGDVLVVGAGHDPYRDLLTSARTIVSTDIDSHSGRVQTLADVHCLPFTDASFDSVVAIEVFEHLRSPAVAAGEVARVLRSGGTALVSVPFLFRVHGMPHDYSRFTAAGLGRLFEPYGRVRIMEYGNRLHAISDLVTTASRVLIPLRTLNHFLAILGQPSADAPSGYVLSLRRGAP